MMPSEHPVREAYRASIKHSLGPSQIEQWEDGLLLVDDCGFVTACGAYDQLAPRLPKEIPVRDYRGSFLVPGFVDCHVHLPQLDCRNKNGLTLLDWLQTYIYPAEAQFADPKWAEAVARRFFDTLLSHGITTAAVYSTVHEEATNMAFKVAQEKGLRVIMGQVLMDQNAPQALLRPATQLLHETERLIQQWHGRQDRLFYAITPRFALTCSATLMKEAGKMATQAGCYFQTHLAETQEEVRQAQTLHHFKNYAGFYESHHCLEKHSLLAHAIYLRDEEWTVLSDHHCAVAHCPTSNVFLKSGTMPLSTVERFGIRCGLGTDVGAGPTFSMREVADCACEVQPKGLVTPEKAFYLSTLGGAEALSLAHQTGNFTEGKWADFAVFDNPHGRGCAKSVYIKGACLL